MLLNCGAEEDSWESQDYKIKLVNPKGNQSWIFIRRTDAEAETPILWLPDAKRQLTGKDADDEKDWGQEEKGMTGDKMIGWHHRLNRHELEQTLGDSEQGILACCSWMWLSDWTTTIWVNTVTQYFFFNLNFFLYFLSPMLAVYSLQLDWQPKCMLSH